MLITIGLRSRPPSSAVFRHIQRIYQMEIAHVYIAALLRQMFCYLFILFFINFHTVYSMNSKHLKRQCEQNLINGDFTSSGAFEKTVGEACGEP